MKKVKIPEERERLCIKCSKEEGSDGDLEVFKTLQKPISVKAHPKARGGTRTKLEWECLECGAEQL